jgi:copper ion binding protein
MPVINTYTVTGMTCGHCVQAVSAEIGRLPGVSDVRVELSTGAVAVTSDHPLPVEEVRAAVDEAGYGLAGAQAGADV